MFKTNALMLLWARYVSIFYGFMTLKLTILTERSRRRCYEDEQRTAGPNQINSCWQLNRSLRIFREHRLDPGHGNCRLGGCSHRRFAWTYLSWFLIIFC